MTLFFWLVKYLQYSSSTKSAKWAGVSGSISGCLEIDFHAYIPKGEHVNQLERSNTHSEEGSLSGTKTNFLPHPATKDRNYGVDKMEGLDWKCVCNLNLKTKNKNKTKNK